MRKLILQKKQTKGDKEFHIKVYHTKSTIVA